MKKLSPFKTALRYDAWKILAVFGVSSAGLAFAFSTKDRFKDHEILDVYVTGSSLDSSFAKSWFESVPNSKIQTVHFTFHTPKEEQYAIVTSTMLSSVSDLYILPSSQLETHPEYAMYSQALKEEELSRISKVSSQSQFYADASGTKRGVLLYDKEKETPYSAMISKWFNLEETSYLFVSNVSMNREDASTAGEPLLFEYFVSFLEMASRK